MKKKGYLEGWADEKISAKGSDLALIMVQGYFQDLPHLFSLPYGLEPLKGSEGTISMQMRTSCSQIPRSQLFAAA